ncbi:MAG: TadE/TadG family type IV pilus assembly protein [Tepidisphaeraceae bacterium]
MSVLTTLRGLRAHRCARRFRRGTEVLEVALIMFFILTPICFGMVTYGYYFFLQHNLQNAAREGARAAIPLGGTSGDATSKITAYLNQAGLTPANFTISIIPDPGSATEGTDITVTVDGVWSTVGVSALPQALGGISSGKVVRGRAVMRKEAS